MRATLSSYPEPFELEQLKGFFFGAALKPRDTQGPKA